MGKSDNIKRMKRLKEQKKLREMAENIHQSSLNEVKKRAEAIGGKVVVNQTKVKYSETLKEFVEPILNPELEIEEIKGAYSLGVLAWNSAVTKEFDEEGFQSILDKLEANSEEFNEVKPLFFQLLDRKQNEYGEYTNIFTDFEIQKIKGVQYSLSVVTAPYQHKNPLSTAS